MTEIALSRLHFPITTLGPGRRIGIWFQGCSIRCPGCISRDTWDKGQGKTSIQAVLQALDLWRARADGLTISGGEPFDQPEALEEILRGWRTASDASVLIFTGYEFNQVAPWLEQHRGLADALVAGPYLHKAPQTLALRGSDNQTLHILSERGTEFASYERQLTAADQRLDVMFDEAGNAWFAGIPAPEMLPRLRNLLHEDGHHATTSDQKASAEHDCQNP